MKYFVKAGKNSFGDTIEAESLLSAMRMASTLENTKDVKGLNKNGKWVTLSYLEAKESQRSEHAQYANTSKCYVKHEKRTILDSVNDLAVDIIDTLNPWNW